MLVRAQLSPALVLSLVLHVLLAAVVINAGARRGPMVDPARGAAWHGETFDVDELVNAPATTVAAPAPTPPVPATPSQPEPEATPAVAAKATETEARAPRPKTERPPRPAKPAAESPPGPSGETGSPRAGSTGEAPGVANLAKAFARALTAASHRDAIWDELPVGEVGSIRLVITLADDGSITESALKEKEEVPAHLVRVVERTLLLMKAGRFALSRADSKQGSETFRVDFVLSQGTPDEDAEDPHHTLNMGFDPPLPEKAGRSYFDHASGRHFEAKITLLPR